MERTIKSDADRKVLASGYINDNALLEYVLGDDNMIHLTIRFVDKQWNGIIEHHLVSLSVDDFSNHLDDIFQVNKEKDTIAIFKKQGESYYLDKLYDAFNHQFESEDKRGSAYQEKFFGHKNKSLVKE